MTNGELSPAHASVLAAGTHDLPAQVAVEAEPVLLEAARRLDPPRLGQAVGHLGAVIDPDTAAAQADRHHARRGLWLAATWDGMVAVEGRLEAEAGQSLLAAWNPWPARPTPTMPVVGGSGGPMPWPSWPGAAWRPGGCPGLVGSAPS